MKLVNIDKEILIYSEQLEEIQCSFPERWDL